MIPAMSGSSPTYSGDFRVSAGKLALRWVSPPTARLSRPTRRATQGRRRSPRRVGAVPERPERERVESRCHAHGSDGPRGTLFHARPPGSFRRRSAPRAAESRADRSNLRWLIRERRRRVPSLRALLRTASGLRTSSFLESPVPDCSTFASKGLRTALARR